jgi:hypothetical protein
MGDYENYRKAEFGDKRLSDRLARLLEQLASDPGTSVSAACQDPYQAKAAYRFVGNDEVTTEAITKITHDITVEKIYEAKPHVLLIPQDTTEINYTNLKETDGLGNIGRTSTTFGTLAHTAMAISDSGEIFGLLAQKLWVRPPEEYGKSDSTRKKLPIEKKESFKWLETMGNTGTSFPESTFVVHVCDREGDIYEFFCKAEEENTNYLCRKTHSRSIKDEDGRKNLDEFIKSQPIAGKINVYVPRDSHTKRKARNAEVEITYGKCTILKPNNLVCNNELPNSIEVYVVSAVKINPPLGQKEISWQLITNVPTNNFEDAVTRVQWYTQRWKIEIFHRTLKSGCKVEELQFGSADKLMKLIAVYSIIALHIMFLGYLGRCRPDESCETCFSEDEWKILYSVANKTTILPDNPPTILEAVVMIAKLGGFLARKSDGFPGVTVIWRGLAKFYTILEAVPFLF